MESSENMDLAKGNTCAEEVPSLIRIISDCEVDGFDSTVIKINNPEYECEPSTLHSFATLSVETKENPDEGLNGLLQHQRTHSISISMPPSPIEVHLKNTKKVLFRDDVEQVFHDDSANSSVRYNEKPIFHSQPIPTGTIYDDVVTRGRYPNSPVPPSKNPRMEKLKDGRYNSFKTWSGRLERQISNLRGKPTDPEENLPQNSEMETLPVDRYFDALDGPELDTLRPSEEILLPEDKQWPFLLRYPISSFGICLGVSSQAIMWKALANSPSTKFLHISKDVNLILWCIAIVLMIVVSVTYLLKLIFYFEAVRREYYHPVRVNFFFAPWIALLFLALGLPPHVSDHLPKPLWYVLMTPIFCLELKIYGQWMSGGQRRLSKVANPSNHLSVVGNFVGALLGAQMGLKEGPIFFFAVGLAHYTVLFVTLYQRLPTNATLPKELHPVFFLFVAAPSVASMAWANIEGSFDYGARIAYFIALFLYFSLAVRVNFFRGFRFSLAWWAYTFPMTGASIATMKYANEVDNILTKALSVTLSTVATLTVTALLVTTIIHAFVLRDLFPNDIAIAISDRKPKPHRNWFPRRMGSSEAKDIEQYLKFANSDGKDVEVTVVSQKVSNNQVNPHQEVELPESQS